MWGKTRARGPEQLRCQARYPCGSLELYPPEKTLEGRAERRAHTSEASGAVFPSSLAGPPLWDVRPSPLQPFPPPNPRPSTRGSSGASTPGPRAAAGPGAESVEGARMRARRGAPGGCATRGVDWDRSWDWRESKCENMSGASEMLHTEQRLSRCELFLVFRRCWPVRG